MSAATGVQQPLQFVDNADWLEKLNVIEFLRTIGKHFSVNAMVQRDSVKTRLEAREQGLSYTEFSYMLLQAYDFLELFRRHGCRAQFGGSDQWGNIVSGTDLIGRVESPADSHAPFGVTVPLITQKNGQKFGKTESGTIWLDPQRTSPYQFFQFWMNVDDDDALAYLKFFTFLSAAEWQQTADEHRDAPHLRRAQRLLATLVTRAVHGDEQAANAAMASSVLFGGDPTQAPVNVFAQVLSGEIPTVTAAPDATVGQILVGELRPFASNGEAKRAVQGNAVSLNGKKIGLADLAAQPERLHGRFVLIKNGKKYFLADLGA
jgi:tyrosyl-tRNA synthetase